MQLTVLFDMMKVIALFIPAFVHLLLAQSGAGGGGDAPPEILSMLCDTTRELLMPSEGGLDEQRVALGGELLGLLEAICWNTPPEFGMRSVYFLPSSLMLEADTRCKGYLYSHANQVSWPPWSTLHNLRHFYTELCVYSRSSRHVRVFQHLIKNRAKRVPQTPPSRNSSCRSPSPKVRMKRTMRRTTPGSLTSSEWHLYLLIASATKPKIVLSGRLSYTSSLPSPSRTPIV